MRDKGLHVDDPAQDKINCGGVCFICRTIGIVRPFLPAVECYRKSLSSSKMPTTMSFPLVLNISAQCCTESSFHGPEELVPQDERCRAHRITDPSVLIGVQIIAVDAVGLRDLNHPELICLRGVPTALVAGR